MTLANLQSDQTAAGIGNENTTGSAVQNSSELSAGQDTAGVENGSNANSSIENSPTQTKTEPVDDELARRARGEYETKYTNSDYLSLYQGNILYYNCSQIVTSRLFYWKCII